MDNPDDICDPKHICADDDRIDTWSVDWSSDKSLYNWYESLDLICEPSWKVSMISFSSFIASLVTLPWAPRLADVYGRKPVLIGANLGHLVAYTMIMLSKSLDVIIAAVCIYGAISAIITSSGYLYLLELVPKKNETRVASILWILDQTTYLLPVLYFWFISKHWFWIVLVGYCFQIVGLVSCFILPESPAFYLSLNRFEETIKSFKIIAKVNGAKDFEQEIEPLKEEAALIAATEVKATTETPPLSYFFGQKTILLNFILMAFIWLISTSNYYIILYLLNTFDQVYLCATASSLSEMLAYLVTGYIFEFLGPKKSYSVSFGMAFVGGIVLLFVGLKHQESWTFVLMVILAKFGIVATQGINYMAHPDMFPTLFSTTSMGYIFIVMYTYASLSNFVTTLEEPIPLIIFTASSGLAAVLPIFLRLHKEKDRKVEEKS